MNKLLSVALFVCVVSVLFCGCSSTQVVKYPAANNLFVTMGDDPGTESETAYIPKGTLIHESTEVYLPIPLIGMVVKLGNADPQYVFDNKITPQVKAMGGDSLTNTRLVYEPPRPMFFGLLGLRGSGTLTVYGQAVKK